MGIESDQLVFDYLSRVGDLAHGTSMTAAERARLVGGLRGEIDRMRAAEGGADSKAAVKKILARLGKPEEVVSSAHGGAQVDSAGLSDILGSEGPKSTAGTAGAAGTAGTTGAAGSRVPGQRSAGGTGGDRGSRASTAKSTPGHVRPSPSPWTDADFSPHLAGPGTSTPTRKPDPEPEPEPAPGTGPKPEREPESEPGPGPVMAPDWWRVESGPLGDGGAATGTGFSTGFEVGTEGGGEGGPGLPSMQEPVPGFVGGIEVPEVLKPPPVDMEKGEGAGGTGPGAAPGTEVPTVDAKGAGEGGGEGGGAKRFPELRRALRARAQARARGARPGGGTAAARRGPRAGGIVELAAAVLLAAGAALGNPIPLAVGWLAAWWSPKLSRTEAKWAAAGMPGLVAGGMLVWMWGRTEGRWGEPIGKGSDALGDALTGSLPVLLRVAAVASALFLVWRARRPARG